MKKLLSIMIGLSAFSGTAAYASLDEFAVSYKAYQGGYEDQGIPSWGDFCSEARTVQDARELAIKTVTAAVEAGDVEESEANEVFTFGVEVIILTAICSEP